MNILQMMADSYFPTITGNAFVAHDFVMVGNASGHNTTIMIDNKRDVPIYYRNSGADVFNISGNDDDILYHGSSIIASKDIDLIILHDGEYPKFDKLLAATNVPIAIAHHYLKPKEMIEADLLKYDYVIVFQRAHKDAYGSLGIDTSRIYYICHPVPNAYLKDYQVERDHRTVVYIGRIVAQKGIHEIFPYLEQFNLTMEIYGPENDSQYLKDLVRTIDDRDDIYIRTGALSRMQMARKFQSSDIFFIGSTSECYSLVCQEAMASGATVIAKDNKDAFCWAGDYIYTYKYSSDLLEIIPKVLDNNRRDGARNFIANNKNISEAIKEFSELTKSIGNQTKSSES